MLTEEQAIGPYNKEVGRTLNHSSVGLGVPESGGALHLATLQKLRDDLAISGMGYLSSHPGGRCAVFGLPGPR